MFKTIFNRLFWTSTAIIFFVVATVSVSMFGFLNKYVMDERFNSAKKASSSIEYLTSAMAMGDFDAKNRRLYESMLASWSLMVEADIVVVNGGGNVFAASGRQYNVQKKNVEKVLDGEIFRGSVTVPDMNMSRRMYVIGIPIHYGNSVIGGIFYYWPPGIMRSTVLDFSTMIFMALLAAMFISLCLVFWESRRICRPLKEINSAVLEMASGKFDKRVTVTTGDEISQLASSFNYMADSLERLEEMRASFVSDISHELRTPMTSISGFVQGILDGTVPKEREREYLEIVLEESTRLARLTNEMFEMTKMTSPEYKLTMRKFDINEAIRLCIIGAEQKIDSKNLQVDVWFENDTINVLADYDAIKRVIINLLDNAVKFSSKGETLTIRVYESNRRVNTEIINYGTGISKEDLPHIFDRFYKSDKSRGRDKGGAGLGLSFVKNIINLHSQKISVSSTDADKDKMKTTFTFTLEKA